VYVGRKFVAKHRPWALFQLAALAVAWMGMAMEADAAGVKMDLANGWRLAPGDDSAWSATGFDESKWKPVRVGVPWGEAGFPDLHGYAWYRVRVKVPAMWEKYQAVRDHGGIVLALGPVDDVDETFVNGVKVGSTGSFPPDYHTAWDVPRAYIVPASLVRWGQENIIAVRVYDGENAAGMYPGPVLLRAPLPDDVIRIEIGPANVNGVFPAGKPVSFMVTVTSRTPAALRGRLNCAWLTDMASNPATLSETGEDFALASRGAVTRTFAFTPAKPGFYVARLEVRLPGGEPAIKRFVLGSGIELVNDPEVKEADFDRFWADRLADLAAVPPKFDLVPQPGLSTTEVEVFQAEMVSYGGVRIRGWYTVPRKPGKYPGILMVPGYGSAMSPATDVTYAAVLALDIRGHGISKQDFNPGDREYMWEGMGGPEKDYVYAGAFMDCIRGLDFLASRPEVDAARLAVTGGSQGGGLTFATAGLDPRVVACAPDVPWLDDWPGYEEAASWAVENYPKYIAANPGVTPARLRRTLSYFDVANLTPRIRCPVLVSIGLQDDVVPPRTVLTAYNRIHAPKELVVYPYGQHEGGGDAHEKIKMRWLRDRLEGGK
jgi:cephalosporin-C deacetylase